MDAVYADNLDEMTDEGDYEAGEEEEEDDGIEEEDGEGEGEEEAAQTPDGNFLFFYKIKRKYSYIIYGFYFIAIWLINCYCKEFYNTT